MEKVDARSQQVVVADKDSVGPQQHVVYFIIVVACYMYPRDGEG
jgi:hypothetical protein